MTRQIGAEPLFSNLSLHLDKGDHLAIMGPSGCGKTTLLRIIAGLDTADAGAVMSRGRCLSDPVIRVAPHLRDIGFVFQTPALWPHLSVSGNIRYGLHGWENKEVEKRVTHLLHRFSLTDMGERRPDSLSGGEARRVSIARSLAPRPALLLLDEPMTHLDDSRREEALDFLLEEAVSCGTTLIMVTHDGVEARRVGHACLRWTAPGHPVLERQA
jgi:iron(III) transport system ATP-binding protein